MKKIAAVICELNPIHPGHSYVLNLAKANSDVVIAVMSGNFTQRGIAAVFDKYARAEAAMKCGADLVVELPFPWCSSGVEDFALGGVSVASGCLADLLTFGSETGDKSLIEQVAKCKSSENYAETMRRAERETRSRGSAAVFDEVMQRYGIMEPLGANDKLGAEYIRFGRECGITDFRPVKRMKDAPSATAVREIMRKDGVTACEDLIPKEAFAVFKSKELCSEERLEELFYTHCRLYVHEDEENDLLRYAAKMARNSTTAAEFMQKLPTKKYTAARMRREVLRSILRFAPESSKLSPKFTVILAANEVGRAYLSEKQKNFRIPVITKPADYSALDEIGKKQYELHRKADELYAYLMGQSADEFMKRHPVMGNILDK